VSGVEDLRQQPWQERAATQVDNMSSGTF
jgi:hypothetical protein